MTFTHALSTNNYGPAKLIVATSAANGTHITLASAMAAAVSGDTIFMRDSVTENVTLTPGVNISAFVSDSSLNATGKVKIIGTLTMTGAGTCTISGVQLETNGSFLLAVTGSANSVVNLINCYLNCTNNTGISYTTSGASSSVMIQGCRGNLATTGIAYFSSSGANGINIFFSVLDNSGGSTTVNSISAGTLTLQGTILSNPITSTGTAALNINQSIIVVQNATCITHGGSGTSSVILCQLSSGTASAISISQTLTVTGCVIISSNTNAITGAGTVVYSSNAFTSSAGINTTTQTGTTLRTGISRSTLQPAFLAFNSAGGTDATGDGTVVTLAFANEIFDQNSNFNAVSTFTAPVTGRYRFTVSVGLSELGAAHTTGALTLVTTNRSYSLNNSNYGAQRNAANAFVTSFSTLTDMNAADTATVTVAVTGGTKTVDILNANTSFSGELVT